MSRKVNWYFNGWIRSREVSASGKEKTVWKYHGVYYQYQLDAKGLKKMKAGYGISAFLLIALWLVFSLAAGVGKDVAFYIGVPWYLLMLPFIYLVMGIYGMFRARERMTYRDMYAGYYRIKYVKWILLILQAVSAAGDIFFMIAYHDCISMGKEIGWFAGVIGCLLCTVCMMVIHRRYPPYQIP